VNVEVAFESGLLDAQRGGVCLGVAPGRAGRFLHDVAELSGQDEVSLAAHRLRFDEENVAAHRGVEHAGRDADLVLARGALRVDSRPAQQVVHGGDVDRDALGFSPCDLARHLARQLAELALELATPAPV
jgi:hypothetical protein